MALRSVTFALSLAAVTVVASAQANTFTMIGKTGKPMGKASYTVDKQKSGFKVRSRFEYKLGVGFTSTESTDPDKQASATVTEAQLSAEYAVDNTGNFTSGFLQNSTIQIITSLTPTKTREEITIGQMQGGVNIGSKTIPMPKPDYLMAADYDPGAMQALITVATTHPHADHTYLFIAPGTGAGPRAVNTAFYMTVADPVDAKGTLDGKPVELKRYPLTWNKSKGDLWADSTGALMQVKIGPTGATYIRNKFTLTTEEQAK